MKAELERVAPMDIERRSFELIEAELPHPLDPATAPIVKRVIHTTADFDYTDNLHFSKNAVEAGLAALREGAVIVTDTTMALSGINKRACARFGCKVDCFIADEDVAAEAKAQGVTPIISSNAFANPLFEAKPLVWKAVSTFPPCRKYRAAICMRRRRIDRKSVV